MMNAGVNKPQGELLCTMVDAARATEDRPESFMVAMVFGDDQELTHPGLTDVRVYPANLRALERAGFLEITEARSGTLMIDVTREGFVYVDQVLRRN